MLLGDSVIGAADLLAVAGPGSGREDMYMMLSISLFLLCLFLLFLLYLAISAISDISALAISALSRYFCSIIHLSISVRSGGP